MSLLRKSQVRIPLIGALASLIFLSSLALLTGVAVRRTTFDDMDEELETLSTAIGSELEMYGLNAVEHSTLRAGVENNMLAFRLERHSALLLNDDHVLAVAGDLMRRPSTSQARAFAMKPEGTFTAIEPFSGAGWLSRFRVTHLSGAANGGTLIVFRSVEPAMRALQRLDLALVMIVIAGVAGSGLIISYAVRRALHPVEQVTLIAEGAQANDLSRRVEVTSGGEEIERLSAVINSLFERLERAFQSQRRLVSDAAHELKTPAAAIMAEAQEAIRPDTPPAHRQELLHSIARSARALARETDDLLTLARDESIKSDRRPVDLRDVAALAIAASQPAARERKIEIHFDSEGNTIVDGHQASLERLVANLVSNAVRYTRPESAVDVGIRGHNGTVQLRVADRGPGIAVGDRARIFERFVRLAGARRVSPDGSGLGLAIVAQAVRNHDGTIEVLDREGGGAQFVVSLPA